MTPAAPGNARETVLSELRSAGYALLAPAVAVSALELDPAALTALAESWARLPRDPAKVKWD